MKNDCDAWMLAEDIPNIDFFFCNIWLRAFVNNMKSSCGLNYSKILGVFHGYDMRFYYGKKSCLEFTLNLVNKMDADPAYGELINKNIVLYSDKLEESANKIPKNLSGKTNEELWGIIEEHVKIHTELYEWGWLSNATDMFYPEFTQLLKNYLRSKLGSEEKLNSVFIALTHADEKSRDAVQHEEMLKIAIAVENDVFHKNLFLHETSEAIEGKMQESIRALFLKYYEAYAPISALWVGEPAPLTHFIDEIAQYLKQGKSPAQEIAVLNGDLQARRVEKQALLKQLDVDEKHARLFKVFSEFMLTKQHRRYAQLRSNYLLRPVFKEIASRFGISERQAHFLLTPEYKRLLVDGDFDIKQLAEREKFCVFYASEGIDEIYLGEAARKLADEAVEKIDYSISELKGQCASLGYAKGRVKIILSPADLPKMEPGDILVAIATNPDVVPAMKKAAAIVTEQGGVTCHAAIVSRELGIPCVIGTKIATKWLKDGDFVEVDATKGIIRKI